MDSCPKTPDTNPSGKPNPTADPSLSPPRKNDERARYVVIDCHDRGDTRKEILEKLMARGYSEVDADRLIENVEREKCRTNKYDSQIRGDVGFLIRFGGATFILGLGGVVGCIIAVCYDYSLAQNPLWLGGMFIAGLAVFIGARLFFRGLWH